MLYVVDDDDYCGITANAHNGVGLIFCHPLVPNVNELVHAMTIVKRLFV